MIAPQFSGAFFDDNLKKSRLNDIYAKFATLKFIT